MTKLYISPDLGTNSSGNLVSLHELEALQSLGNNVIQIGYDQMNPVKYGLPDTPFLQDYLTMDKIASLNIQKGQIDICHLYASPFTNTIRYLKAIGIKIILTIAAHDRTESMNEFENLGFEYPYIHVKNKELWKIYNGGVKEANIVITPSKVSAEFLKKEGVEENRIRIIPHGTDIPTTDKIKSTPEFLHDKFTVGYLGKYGPDKGLKYLIQAWSKLDYKDSALLFGGKYSKDLEPFIKKFSTGGIFRLLGWIENIETFYNMCSIYVQPSVTEAFGIEILEAMSYGKPVIASDGAGASELIENGKNGFVTSKRDWWSIADKIAALKSHPEELIQMGKNARKIAEEYSWDKIKGKYINVYSSI